MSYPQNHLRRAFRSLPDPPKRTPDSIHGTFGRTEDWADRSQQIRLFLSNDKGIDVLCHRMCALTGLATDDVATLIAWVRNELGDAVDAAVDSPYYLQSELSELLANAGVLPMFGFPTRVRDLHSRWIKKRDDLDRFVVSNRSLDQAIGNFSPGAEVVRA